MGTAALAAVAVFIGVVLPFIGGKVVRAVPAVAPVAPAGEYIGVKQCSACHFKEYMVWKKHQARQGLYRRAGQVL